MVNIRPLTPGLQKKAEKELNEDSNRIEEELEILRDWISKQPHLNSRPDDQFLISFLRGCKHSLEKAKDKLDSYYTIRSAIPELFLNRNPEDSRTEKIRQMGIGTILPQTIGEDGPRIFLLRCGLYDTTKYNIREIIRASTLIGDIQMLEDDNVVVSGRVEIWDLKNVTAAHLFQFDAQFVKKLTKFGQDGVPIRNKGIHFINTPPGFEIAVNLLTKFMNDKNKSKIRSHGNNLESLYEYIPKRLLPVEYGGENGSIDEIVNHWEKKVISYRDYFLDESKYGTNEKLRIGTPQNAETLFGINGTFRKLEVD